jgi:hypothetical protein
VATFRLVSVSCEKDSSSAIRNRVDWQMFRRTLVPPSLWVNVSLKSRRVLRCLLTCSLTFSPALFN